MSAAVQLQQHPISFIQGRRLAKDLTVNANDRIGTDYVKVWIRGAADEAFDRQALYRFGRREKPRHLLRRQEIKTIRPTLKARSATPYAWGYSRPKQFARTSHLQWLILSLRNIISKHSNHKTYARRKKTIEGKEPPPSKITIFHETKRPGHKKGQNASIKPAVGKTACCFTAFVPSSKVAPLWPGAKEERKSERPLLFSSRHQGSHDCTARS